jgi:phage/plasmid-associated DNA primase
MNIENFDLNKIKTLSPIEAKQYIDKYFIPLTNGDHAFYVNGKYEIMDDAIIKKTYFKRMPSELNKYYFQDKTDLKTLSYDVNKPAIYENYLNQCPRIKQTYKKYSEFSEDIKKKVDIVLNHILEVYCSGRKDSYNFILKWFSNMIRGNRNNSALYLKGPQGAGKSSIVDDFIRPYVIGLDLSYQGGSAPLKNNFNSELSGKLMVLFEELENMGKSEWMAVSCKLKRQITSKTIQIERKGKDIRDETNLNNYILLSNNDCIQDDDGRRYFILDISTKYVGNREYFKKLHSCFNDIIGQAFYSYLMEIDIKDYDPQAYPMTQSKLDSFSKRLDNVFLFIKQEFILKKLPLTKTSLSILHQHYEEYCLSHSTKSKGKIEFNNTLKSVGIVCYKSDKCHKFNLTYEDLKAISDKYHWVHNFDLDEEEDNTSPIDHGLEQEPDYKALYFELLAKQTKPIIKKALSEDEELELELNGILNKK